MIPFSLEVLSFLSFLFAITTWGFLSRLYFRIMASLGIAIIDISLSSSSNFWSSAQCDLCVDFVLQISPYFVCKYVALAALELLRVRSLYMLASVLNASACYTFGHHIIASYVIMRLIAFVYIIRQRTLGLLFLL